MATKADLVSRTLWRLRARGTGQQPMPEDASEVAAVIDDKLMDLALRGKFYVGDPDQIPDGSMDWLSRLMEMTVAAAFGSQESADDIAYAEQMLLAQSQQNVPTFRKLEYF